jgi:hypothetical protein
MKKALILLTMLALLAAVSTVYACGEESGSKADANQSKTEMTAASEATVTPAIVKSDKDMSVEKADYGCCAGKAGVSKASADGHCGAMNDEVKAEQTVVRKTGAREYSCPASASCPTPCNKDAKSSSASNDKDAESEKVISTSAEVAPEAGTLK